MLLPYLYLTEMQIYDLFRFYLDTVTYYPNIYHIAKQRLGELIKNIILGVIMKNLFLVFAFIAFGIFAEKDDMQDLNKINLILPDG